MKHKASVSIEAAIVVPFVFLTIVMLYTLIGYLHIDYQLSRAATEAAIDFSHDSYLLNYLDVSELLAHHGFQRQSLKPADIVKMEQKVGKLIQNRISFETKPNEKFLEEFKGIVDMSKQMMENIAKIPSEISGIVKTEVTILVSRLVFNQYLKNRICQNMENIPGFKAEKLKIEVGRYFYDFKASEFYVSYCHEFPLKFSFMKEAEIIQPVYIESFIGNVRRYQGEKYKPGEKKETEQEEQTVYMVNLKTYHTLKECFSINPKPKAYRKNLLLNDKRTYQQCKICQKNKWNFGNQVYKTEISSVYHADLKCSAIKREVVERKLSEVGEAKKCQHCINAQKRRGEGE